MEIEGVKEIMVRLNTSQKIIGFIHVPDAKTSNYIGQCWNITGYMDELYASESFLGYFDNFQIGNAPPNSGRILRGLKKNIESYGNLLVHSNFSSERKAMPWMNAVEHYKGNHTNCIHAP